MTNFVVLTVCCVMLGAALFCSAFLLREEFYQEIIGLELD